MKRWKRWKSAAALVLAAALTAAVAAAGSFAATPSDVKAAGITPYFLTVSDLEEKTTDGVSFKVRRDYAHPYVIRSASHGDAYNRVLVVEMTIINSSSRTFNYTAYTEATDAAGRALVNAEPLAACEFGTLEPGKSANVVARFLLKKGDDVSSFRFVYQHLDYSAQYLADMNAWSLGQLPIETIAAKYVPEPVSFTIVNPKQ